MLQRLTVAMRSTAALSLMLIGCTSAASDDGGADAWLAAQTPPAITGIYAGRYTVPTTADLAAAAVFDVAEVDWTVTGTTVTLEYALPVGLVGGHLRVAFTGPLGAPSQLVGTAGTGTCTGTSATGASCREVMPNLGALPLSADVVMQTAALEYAGPAADRAKVATVFSSDPIGVLEIDFATPVIPDDSHPGAR